MDNRNSNSFAFSIIFILRFIIIKKIKLTIMMTLSEAAVPIINVIGNINNRKNF